MLVNVSLFLSLFSSYTGWIEIRLWFGLGCEPVQF
jgi:hypothetical protein